jgi:ATP-dependent Clp protease ATP-binding subunit ClpB
MNPEKFTEKSAEALNAAIEKARSLGNAEITEAHIVYALLKDGGGLISEILKSINI